MANIEYKKNQTVRGENLEEVQKFVQIFEDEIVEKRHSEENLGLAFYICGYNGDAQNRLRDKWAERGVHVF